MAQLDETLRYKSEGHGFDSRWCHRDFSFFMALGSSSPLTNEYQEYFLEDKGGRCVGVTTLSPLCDDCHEIWEPQTYWNPQGLSRPTQGLLYFGVRSLYLTIHSTATFGSYFMSLWLTLKYISWDTYWTKWQWEKCSFEWFGWISVSFIPRILHSRSSTCHQDYMNGASDIFAKYNTKAYKHIS